MLRERLSRGLMVVAIAGTLATGGAMAVAESVAAQCQSCENPDPIIPGSREARRAEREAEREERQAEREAEREARKAAREAEREERQREREERRNAS